jgi:hypothetical protein
LGDLKKTKELLQVWLDYKYIFLISLLNLIILLLLILLTELF